jgi:hypothetical protein
MRVIKDRRGLPIRDVREQKEAFARRIIHHVKFVELASALTEQDALDVQRGIQRGFIERAGDWSYDVDVENPEAPPNDPALLAYTVFCMAHNRPLVSVLISEGKATLTLVTSSASWCLSPGALGHMIQLMEAYETSHGVPAHWDVEIDEVVVTNLPVHVARALASQIFQIAMDCKPVEFASGRQLETVDATDSDEWLDGVVRGEIPFPEPIVPGAGNRFLSALKAAAVLLVRSVPALPFGPSTRLFGLGPIRIESPDSPARPSDENADGASVLGGPGTGETPGLPPDTGLGLDRQEDSGAERDRSTVQRLFDLVQDPQAPHDPSWKLS